MVRNAETPTAAWTSLNDFIITWDQPCRTDNGQLIGLPSTPSAGVYGVMWDINGNQIRTIFRANSGNIDYVILPPMPLGRAQGGNQVAVDADGDLTVIYSGFGPDASPKPHGRSDIYTRL